MPETPEPQTPRFFAWLYCARLQQPVIAALCGIEREVGASLRPGVDHQVAHTRLEWWREECARCAAGHPVHPLTRELRIHLERLESAARVNSILGGLSGLVDAASWDLASAPFERRAQLTAYCRGWAAAMVTPLGAAEVDWTDFGAALCELELLGHLARDARRGRVRIALDELDRSQVAPQALATPPWPQGLATILRARHQALRRELAAVIAALAPATQQSARGLLVWAAIAWQASQRAQRALPRAPAASIASAAAANWRAWRAARAAAAGSLRLG
jgi:15-cis-phytoene synthase